MNYCPQCGEETSEVEREGRKRDYCHSCEEVLWNDASPCVGTVVVRGGEVLMVKRGIEPWKGLWSLPAGYMEPDEEPKKAAVRELEEETGVGVEARDLEIFDAVHLTHPDGKQVIVIVYRTGVEGPVDLGGDSEVKDVRFKKEVEHPAPLLERLEDQI